MNNKDLKVLIKECISEINLQNVIGPSVKYEMNNIEMNNIERNNMTVIEVLDELKTGSVKSVFLAGPTHRINGNQPIPPSWRDEAIKELSLLNYDGVIYSPEWEGNVKPEGWTYESQVQWEVDALNAATVVLFWVPRNMESLPALTTNIEFGEWLHSGKCVVGAPLDAVKMDYIKTRCIKEDVPFHTSLSSAINDSLSRLNKIDEDPKVWFTSDTHFGQERTLELSRRLFRDVKHMDRELVRNWNKVIKENDTVYHLGDWGDINKISDVLPQLNGKRIITIPGNYDKEDIQQVLSSDPRIEFVEQGHTIKIQGIDVSLVHEPENMQHKGFYLFGHIHQLQMVKTNALNVGTDCHNYSPINEDDVMFYHNAITNFYDDNVFSNFLK
jgi:calcineurin-like phosphoesterase family protein